MTAHLFWTNSKYMCLLNKDKNTYNLWLFFIFLLMAIPWQIMKTWKIYFNFWRSKVFPENISLTHQGGGWYRSCTLYCWRLPKQHLLLPPSLQLVFMESPRSITRSGCQSIYMWRHIPILLCVEIVSLSTTSDNIFSLMVKCMLDFGGLRVEELAEKLVSSGCDGSNVFQGRQTSVTTQFRDKVTPFISGVHYFAH